MNLNLNLRKKVNWVKERKLELQYYSIYKIDKSIKQKYVAMVDGRFSHGGLSDRLKGAVSLYAYCKATTHNYGLNFSSPFNLADYLLPNRYDWRIASNEISHSYWNTRVLIMTSEYDGARLMNLSTSKQVHYYNNLDIIDVINERFGTSYTYGGLFNELFSPVPQLLEHINHHKSLIGNDYIAAVFRFQHLLGDFQEYDFPELAQNKRVDLMARCKQAVVRLMSEFPDKICLVTSDSVTFLKYVAGMKGVYTLPGDVVHMDVTKDASYSVYMKSFLDLYMIAGAQQVFCVGTKDMYPSEFPLYAAKINNVPFYRYLI